MVLLKCLMRMFFVYQRAKAFEAMKMQKLMKEEFDGVPSPQLGPLDQTFGCYPSLPFNT